MKQCTICDGKRFYSDPPKPCYRCKGTGKVNIDWVEPALPSIKLISKVALEVGYTVAVHDPDERHYELVAAPWTDKAISNAEFMYYLCAGINARLISMERRPHNRFACVLEMLDGAYRLIDLSIMPLVDSRVAA